MHKKVLLIHYHIGERDGVSLEIEKRARIFLDLGHEVFFLTGKDSLQRKNSFIIPELDFENKTSEEFYENVFVKGEVSEQKVITHFKKNKKKLVKKINEVFKLIRPDIIFIHNMLSYGRNLPATQALQDVLDIFQIPTIIVNHDLWFERDVFVKNTSTFISSILHQLPPDRNYIIKQEVINSIAQDQLYHIRGIQAEKIGDYFAFRDDIFSQDSYNKDLKSRLGIGKDDFIVLHATRIVKRKAIENALYFCYELQKSLQNGQQILLGSRIINSRSRVILLLPNFIEIDAQPYFIKLKALAKKLQIYMMLASNFFSLNRKTYNNKKVYSFWDAYTLADIVTYTSAQEGFGNQFFEAVEAKKLCITFEYPVFKEDIKPEGYYYISLGDRMIKRNGFNVVPIKTVRRAVKNSIDLLNQENNLKKLLNQNFEIGKKYHSTHILRESLMHALNSSQ